MAVGSIDLSRVNISLAEFQKMSDGKYNAGEVKLSSETGLKKVNNHVHRLGTNGGTLCQNPETNAYVLMRPVPLARLDGEEAFGAIVEETLAQVERWQKILGGLREAENTLADQTAEATASFDINAFIQV